MSDNRKESSDEVERARRRLRERILQVEPNDGAQVYPTPKRGARSVSYYPTNELLDVAKGKATLPRNFIRFIGLWEAFNGWLRIPPEGSSQKHGSTERKLLEDFKASPVVQENFRQLVQASQEYKKSLAALRSLSPVYKVQGVTRTKVELHDEQDLGQVMELIYQIRNNLFHGAKSLYDERDQELVTAAHHVLLPLFEKLFDDSRATHHHMGGQ